MNAPFRTLLQTPALRWFTLHDVERKQEIGLLEEGGSTAFANTG